MSEETRTRTEVDQMAVDFLRNNGPHTMGPIESDDEMAAMMVFLDLEKAGLVHRTVIAPGYLQFSLKE